MLFTRLFNWIKYKTLPPSVLFSNRLFVERDSKHRRVTSNLGLTFRNSKWSTYARTNINLSNRTSYFGLILKLLLLFVLTILLYNFSNFYNIQALASPIYTILWFISDSDLYLKVAFSSSLLCSLQLVFSFMLNGIFPHTSFSDESRLFEANSKAQVPRRLHKPILHAWLTADASSNSFEKLLASESSPSSFMELYKSLFRSSLLVTKSSESLFHVSEFMSNSYSRLNLPCPESSTLSALTINSSARLNSLGLDFYLFKRSARFDENYFSECDSWTLNSLQTEFSISTAPVNTVTGTFYTPSISHTDLSLMSLAVPELSTFKSSVNDQLSMIQWQRWLYKYNILHRSVLRASSSMTLTKRLINSGFYNSSIATRNIWSSSALKSGKLNFDNVGVMHNSLYGDFNGLNTPLDKAITSTSAYVYSSQSSNLQFYELSYHWFIQRFYTLNTLITNTLSSHPHLYLKSTSNSNLEINHYANSSLNLQLLRDHAASCSYSILDRVELGQSSPQSSSQSVLYPLSTHLAYGEYSIFTKYRVELCQNIIQNPSTKSNQFFTPSRLLP